LILSGEYIVTFTSEGYSPSNYILTMNEGSHQVLNIYASSNATSESVIFAVYDTSSNAVLEGVLISQRKILNGSYVTIESKLSDISGRAQFTYFENIPYYFIASKDSYVDKEFSLTPLFSSYSVLMSPSSSSNSDVYTDDVVVSLIDYSLVNGSSWFYYSFFSPLGSLESYSVSVVLVNGSSFSSSGVVAVGSYINVSFPVSGVSFGDSALVTISYKSTLNSGVKSSSRVFLFSEWDDTDGGIASFKADIDGYSPIEKIFWLTIVILSLSSLFALFGFASGEYFVFASIGAIMGVVTGSVLGLINWVAGGFVIFLLVLFIIGRMINDG